MRITKFIFCGLVIFCFTLGNATAQESIGDPDSESAPAEVPAGWGDSTISVQDNEETPSETTEPAPEAEDKEAELPIPKPAGIGAAEAQPELEDGDKWHEMKFARLQGLNKVTARTSEIKSDINAKTKFGNLELIAEKCMRGPENERAENTVLLTVWDEIPGQERKQIFHGWMFSSSPAISALEHPIYDIILLGCGEAPKPVVAPKEEVKEVKKAKKPKMEIEVR